MLPSLFLELFQDVHQTSPPFLQLLSIFLSPSQHPSRSHCSLQRPSCLLRVRSPSGEPCLTCPRAQHPVSDTSRKLSKVATIAPGPALGFIESLSSALPPLDRNRRSSGCQVWTTRQEKKNSGAQIVLHLHQGLPPSHMPSLPQDTFEGIIPISSRPCAPHVAPAVSVPVNLP